MRQTLERLVAMGELPPTTAIDLQQSHLNRLNEQKALEHALTEAHATLRRLLGLAPWVQLTLTSTLDNEHRLCPHCTDALPSAEDFFLHPSVQEQCLRLNAQETTLQAEIQRQYPDLKLGPLYEYEDGENILGFALGLDLPLWNRNRLAIAQAEADRNASRLSTLQTWRTLIIEGHNLKAQLDSARKNAPLPTTFDLNHLQTLLEQGEIGIDEYFTFYDRLFEGRRALLETQATIDRLRAELTRFLIVKE
jgi:outer membrane protein TolC